MYLVSNIIVKVLATSVRGWFVESFGIVGIPTLAFNPLHSWLSIDHHSLLQVALCQLEKFAPVTESKTPQERRKWQGIETRGAALKSISKSKVTQRPPIFRTFQRQSPDYKGLMQLEGDYVNQPSYANWRCGPCLVDKSVSAKERTM